jgi:hypothetical protein
MTEAITLGQWRPWRHTASRSTTEAHAYAARGASRVRAKDAAAAARYGQSDTCQAHDHAAFGHAGSSVCGR